MSFCEAASKYSIINYMLCCHMLRLLRNFCFDVLSSSLFLSKADNEDHLINRNAIEMADPQCW